jgi:hypothetical protein
MADRICDARVLSSRICLSALVLSLAGLAAAHPSNATTFVVTNTTDNVTAGATGSLRDAINKANTQSSLDNTVTGALSTFQNASEAEVVGLFAFNALTFANAQSTASSAIYVGNVNLAITSSTFVHNSSCAGGAVHVSTGALSRGPITVNVDATSSLFIIRYFHRVISYTE